MLDNRLAIASVSLGQHPSHTLPQKITAAASAGFSGIEITYPDLSSHATSQSLPILSAAQQIHSLCKHYKLTIIALVSFQNYEGSTLPLSSRLQTAKHWLAIARTLEAEHIQVPATYDRNTSTDAALIVDELRQLADLAAADSPVVKIAYENLAWSTHCILWQDAVRIVKAVDRVNFGLCLDSFHISVALWGDPYAVSGRQEGGEERLRESMRVFVEECPRDKLFYVQLSDGEVLDPVYSESHPWYDESLEVEHVWSNEARPFPGEVEFGAYMPVEEIARAFIKDVGFEGWVSLETFDRRMREEAMGPEKNAKRGVESWRKLRERLLKE